MAQPKSITDIKNLETKVSDTTNKLNEQTSRIDVLSEYKNMGNMSASNPSSNYRTGLFNVGTPVEGKYFYVTKIKYPDLGDGYYKLIAYGFDASDDKVKDSIWTGRIHAGQFTGWVEYATTEQINNLYNTHGYVTSRQMEDFNACVKNGKYSVAFNGDGVAQHAPPNIWAGESTFAVDVTQEHDTVLVQEICAIYGVNQGRKFYRVNTFGTWTDWKEIAISTKVDITQCLTNGWRVADSCNFSAKKIGNRLFVDGIVVNSSTPSNSRLAVNLPHPSDGKWHGGTMVGLNNSAIYFVINPTGEIELQAGGHLPNVLYSVSIDYPV